MEKLMTVTVKSIFLSEFYTQKWGNRANSILGWSMVAFIEDEEFLGDEFREGAVELAVYSKNALYRPIEHKFNGLVYQASEVELISPIYQKRGENNKTIIIKPNYKLRICYKSVQKKLNKQGNPMRMACGREFFEIKIPLITGICDTISSTNSTLLKI